MLRGWNRTLMADSRAVAWLTALLAVAGFALGFLAFAENMPGGDGSNYLLLAQSLLHGGDFSIERHYDGPVMPGQASRELPQVAARERRGGLHSVRSPRRGSLRLPNVTARVGSSATTTVAAASVTEGLATRLWWLLGSSARAPWADPGSSASINAGLSILTPSRSFSFQPNCSRIGGHHV